MPNFKNDQIDYVCEMNKGHKNWAYADMIAPKILKREIELGNVIVFFDKPDDGKDTRNSTYKV